MKNPQILQRAGSVNMVLVLLPTASCGGCGLFSGNVVFLKPHGDDSAPIAYRVHDIYRPVRRAVALAGDPEWSLGLGKNQPDAPAAP